MTELLPTLRESLRETAERRYRRRRRPALVPALIAVGAVAAALLVIGAVDFRQPADEVPATPTATATATATPTPAPVSSTPTPETKIEGSLHPTPVAPDDPSLKEALSLLDPSHKVVRAWSVPGMKGHVLLTRKGDQWCLSAPDPLAGQPDAERGVGCVPPDRFHRRGAYIGIGSIRVTVKPDQTTIRIRQR
jgi:hypothetical protein